MATQSISTIAFEQWRSQCRQRIVSGWFEALRTSIPIPGDGTEALSELDDVADQALRFIFDESRGIEAADDICTALASFGKATPEVLGHLLQVLASALFVGLSPDDARRLQARHAILLGVIATGYGRAIADSALERYQAALSSVELERAGVQRALRASEERFTQLIDLLPVGYLAVKPGSGEILIANQLAVEFLDVLSQGDVVGKTAIDFLRAEQAGMARAYIARMWVPESPMTFSEERIILSDGSIREVEFAGRLLADLDEPIVQVIFRDISDRKAAETALRESEALFRTLAETTVSAIFMFRDRYNIYVNEAACDITGYSKDELLAMPFWQMIRPDYQAIVRERGLARQRGEAIETNYEVPIVAKDGSTRWVQFAGTVIDYQGSPAVLGTAFEITQHVLDERKLQSYAQRLELLAEIDRVGLTAHSKRGIASAVLALIAGRIACDRASITEVDSAHQSMSVLSTYPREQAKVAEGRRFRLEQWQAIAAQLKRGIHYVPHLEGIAGRTPLQEEIYEEGVRSYMVVPLSFQNTLVGVLNIGSFRAEAYGEEDFQIATEVSQRVAMVLRNADLFAELETSHQHLRKLSRQLVQVQENERRLLARELHDEIAQALTALGISLELATHTTGSRRAGLMAQAQRLVQDLSLRVRTLSLDLRPPMLDDLGLLPTLYWHFDRCAEQLRIRVAFEHQGIEKRLDPEIEIVVYRIVQEALTNIARHSGTDAATVRLWADATTLSVQIEDRGKGFDVREVFDRPSSGGLSGMLERVRQLGGQLSLDTHPGTGTCLTALIPIASS